MLPILVSFVDVVLTKNEPFTLEDIKSKLRNHLIIKREIAKFLEKTLDSMSESVQKHTCVTDKELTDFFKKVKQEGVELSIDEILTFSKLLKDKMALDSLTGPQVDTLRRVLKLETIKTSDTLRFQLCHKICSLAINMKMIKNKGIDSLTLSELQHACKVHSMGEYGLSEKLLRKLLTQWIDLSLNDNMSIIVLLKKIRETKLPEGEGKGKPVAFDNKAKFEAIKEEEHKLKECLKEQNEESKENKIKKDIDTQLGDDKTTEESKLNIDELIGAVAKLQNIPDDEKLKKICEVLRKIDDDHEGSIRLDTVLKVMELIVIKTEK